MTDLDLLERLAAGLKTAGIKDQIGLAASAAKNFAQNNKASIIGAGVAAGLGGLGSYLAAKPGKDGKPSADQKMTAAVLRLKRSRTGNGEGFATGLADISAQTSKQIADLSAKYPGKTGLMGAAMASGIGWAMGGKVKKSSIQPIVKIADEWGRELAHEKIALDLGAIGKAVGSAGKAVMRTPVAKRMAVGAIAGAGADTVANKDSSLGSKLTAGGLGAVAGGASKPALKRLRRSPSDLGKGVAQGMKGWQNKPPAPKQLTPGG